MNTDNTKKTGIYIHIPFCKSKCYYCDFVSYAAAEKYYEWYKDTLIKEIKNCGELKKIEIGSIFIGGGTPTVFPPIFLCQILNQITKFKISKDAEITVEANPGTLSAAMLSALKNSGVNRLSMGLQAWQDSLLKRIGRIHTLEHFLKNYSEARRQGFENINVDIMFSLPGQRIEDFRETLEGVAGLSPTHISAYSLIVEENTPFGEMLSAGKFPDQDEELDRRLYHEAIEFLKNAGYNHYEISNFSKPDYECRANVLYWERGEYLGFGVGAHSFFNGIRFNNTPELSKYLAYDGHHSLIVEEQTKISESEAMEEFVFLGLRMMNGISATKFKQDFGRDIWDIYGAKINKLQKNNLLKINGDRIFLTLRGIDISNQVFAEFLL